MKEGTLICLGCGLKFPWVGREDMVADALRIHLLVCPKDGRYLPGGKDVGKGKK
jgi:hypothetical protein